MWCVSRLRLLFKHVETDSEDHTFYCLFCLFIGAKPYISECIMTFLKNELESLTNSIKYKVSHLGQECVCFLLQGTLNSKELTDGVHNYISTHYQCK